MTYYKCGSIHPTQNSNVVVDTASGAVANFDTSLALPLKSLEVDVNAVQEAGTPTPQSPKAISGVSAVSVIHCGKNLFDINNIALCEVASGSRWGYSFSKAGTYKASVSYNGSAFLYCVVKAVDGTFGSSIYLQVDTTITPRTITVNEGETLIFYNASANQTEALTKQKMSNAQIEVGTTTTEHEPYNGSTTLINLGGTYYGGHFAQDKDGHRQFEVTHGIKPFGDIPFSRSNNGGAWGAYLFYARITDKTNGGVLKCSNYEYVIQTTSTMQNEKIISTGSSKYIYVRDDAYTTVADFKTANANTQLVYPLATPYVVDLPDGEPIKSFPGINNIFCDTGDTSLQFRKIG